MIIAQAQNDIVKHGIDASKKATINQDKLAKLQFLLTKGLYSDPESAIIVEWTNNAVDAIVQAGKNPIENPVIVTITDNKFSVKDCGIGLNKEEFETVCMSYLSSTKEETNDQIGAFGIGMKSFMSLDRAATFICRKEGYEWKFLAYQGSEFMEYDLISEGFSEEESGVICEISLNGWQEARNFKEKAKAKLAYYDTVVLNINGQIIDNNIIRSEKWQFSNQNDEDCLHLCLKDVFYKIDYARLGISPINIPIALRFNLNEGLQPTPSRESLIWNTHTINLVKQRIKDTANWFVNKYNENWKEYETFQEAYHEIYNSNKEVIIADELFKINDLLKYSDVIPLELKIKGINIENPKYYKDLSGVMFDEYECLVHYKRGKWSVKYVKDNHNVSDLLNENKHILVDKIPTGKIKRYLLEKYKGDIFFIKKVKTRRLGSLKNSFANFNDINYTYVLDLVTKHPKSEWRNRILEFQYVQNQLTSLFIQETNIESSQEYQEWLIKDKEYQKANRTTYGSSGKHKVLNKQKGEVTLGMIVDKEIGTGYKIDKQTFKIEEFHKIPKLTICFEETQKNRAKDFYALLHGKFNICVVGKNEFNKLKDKHNFMTEKQWQDSKSFKRIVTSIKYDELVNEFNNLFDRGDIEIIKELVKPLYDDVQILKDYVNKNNKRVNSQILNELLAVAEEHNLYDYEFSDVYNRVKDGIKKYEFINLIVQPNSWNDEAKAKVKKLIGQILYHQKMYHSLHENIEIELKPIVKEEETILEEQLETA